MSVALVIQHEKCMRHFVICGLSGSTIFSPTFSHKQHDFLEKVIEYKVYVFPYKFVQNISYS